MKNIDDEVRAIRGGSWFNVSTGCRAFNRYSFVPGSRDDFIGFRVVLSARAYACAATPQDRVSLP